VGADDLAVAVDEDGEGGSGRWGERAERGQARRIARVAEGDFGEERSGGGRAVFEVGAEEGDAAAETG